MTQLGSTVCWGSGHLGDDPLAQGTHWLLQGVTTSKRPLAFEKPCILLFIINAKTRSLPSCATLTVHERSPFVGYSCQAAALAWMLPLHVQQSQLLGDHPEGASFYLAN